MNQGVLTPILFRSRLIEVKVSDSIVITEPPYTVEYLADAEVVVVTDLAQTGVTHSVSVSDTVDVTDVAAAHKILSAEVSDTVDTTDAVSALGELGRSSSDSLVIYDIGNDDGYIVTKWNRTWNNIVWCDDDGASLTSTMDTGGNWGMGATSVAAVSVNGYVKFTPATVMNVMAGLCYGITDYGWDCLAYGFCLIDSGYVEMVEEGIWIYPDPLIPYSADDVFRVEVVDGVVRYYQNDILIRTSPGTIDSYPLYFNCSFYDLGDSIENIAVVNTVSAADAVVTTDATGVGSFASRVTEDTVVTGDSLGVVSVFSRTANDTGVTADSASTRLYAIRSVATDDSVVVTDLSVATEQFNRSASDSIILDDEVENASSLVLSASDNAISSDATARSAEIERSLPAGRVISISIREGES